MEKKCKIYTLKHPTTNEIRYVGKTTQPLLKRLGQHMDYAKKKRTKTGSWIQSLVKQELKPIIEELDEVSVELTVITEQYWISQFKAWGFRLTNLTDGGEGLSGYTMSEESKKKISKNRKGINPNFNILHTEESKEKLRAIHLGRKPSQETRDKIAEINRQRYASGSYSIKVIDLDTNIVYDSIQAASKALNINGHTLRKRVKKNIGNIKKLENTINLENNLKVENNDIQIG